MHARTGTHAHARTHAHTPARPDGHAPLRHALQVLCKLLRNNQAGASLLEAFKAIDSNADGLVTRAELRTALRRTGATVARCVAAPHSSGSRRMDAMCVLSCRVLDRTGRTLFMADGPAYNGMLHLA